MKVTSKLYLITFSLVLLFGFVIRIIPVLSNNFHFTMDQGNDAVQVREIVERGQFPLIGPETNISGVYNGVLWYYFLSIGYILTNGHPASAVILLIFLSLATTAIVMYTISKKISPWAGLLTGTLLQIFWWFFDVSRYGFNPFPLVTLTILVIILLTNLTNKSTKSLLIAAILTGLGFHTEIAGATVLAILFFATLLILIISKRMSIKTFFLSIVVFSAFFLPHLIYELKNGFSEVVIMTNALFYHDGLFSQKQYANITTNLIDLVLNSAAPRHPFIASILWAITIALAIKSKIWVNHRFTFQFSLLATFYFLISLLLFGSNIGWRTWHTVAIPPLAFITLILITLSLPKFIKAVIIALIIIFQGTLFLDLYTHFLNPLDDQSLLKNELKSIDWVYQKADNQGFNVYNYLPSVRDYSHQYLFWWYGKKKYGYLPCEYSRYLGIPSFYVPGFKHYQNPQKPCANLRFLIIEPDDNKTAFNQWYKEITQNTKILESEKIGRITVEKRQTLP